MSRVKLSPDELLVSFDVSSLFTNVPIDEVVDVICERLLKDATLDERTALQPNSIARFMSMIYLLLLQGHVLRTKGRSCDGLTSVSCGSQPLHGAL